MEYTQYLKEVDQAAEATGGKVVSLAGGSFGVQLPVDGAHLVLTPDLDTDQGWVVWAENQDGERCCDAAEEVIGDSPLDQLRSSALATAARHLHDPVSLARQGRDKGRSLRAARSVWRTSSYRH